MLKWKGRRLAATCACCIEPLAGISRRQFVAGAAATGLAAAVAPKVFAQAAPHRIDVHAHIVPPAWFAAMQVIGRDDFPLKNWSVAKMIEDMDKGGVATSMTSPTTPQVTPLGKDTAVKVARESNEYAKKLMADHPGRFGVWATLPLPHIDESLKEIAFAFDTLKVDGIGMMTSYGDKWLGHPMFAPIWEELNRRKATVYTHPTSANCCANLVQGVPDYVIEFGTDTTRTIASLILSGTSQKYPDINWIWSHGGGALTAFAERFQWQLVNTTPYKGKITLEQMNGELKRFYYDTAAISGAVTLGALNQLVSASQIVYGTDFPYRTAADHTKGVTAFFKGDELKKVERENALKLAPRLKSA
ncbi:MAG: amidohydrolase family protein [Alphaproteobacteria bacterium]|nr:amidohydrolase family protein [Alphaproteobacteria bacterium]